MLALASFSYAQELPSSIRGYKVHRVKVHVRSGGEQKGGEKEATVKIGQPRIIDIGLEGLTLEATAEISGLDQDGQVDSLTFNDVIVNGIPLRIEDYEQPFKLKKAVPVLLPVPVRGTVSSLNVAKAAYKEATASRDIWQVSGTVLVFGRFRKMGITFKRVIPVPIDLTIPNPLKALVQTR